MVQQHVLATLPNHAHQIIGAFLSYSTLFGIVSPQLSAYLIPNRYRSFPQRTRINWNVRIVSLVQAILICSLSLRVIFTDKERPGATVADRLWAYSPSGGRIQAFAAGYFIWDLLLSTWYIQILGIGSLTHAICALSVTMLGFVSCDSVVNNVLHWHADQQYSDRLRTITASTTSSTNCQPLS